MSSSRVVGDVCEWILDAVDGQKFEEFCSDAHSSSVLVDCIRYASKHGYPVCRLLMERLSGHVVRLATREHGHRVLTEAVTQTCQNALYELVQNLLRTTVQAIETMHQEKGFLAFIVTELSPDVLVVSGRKYGSSVLQTLLEFVHDDGLDRLISPLVRNSRRLVKDGYGHRVIEAILLYQESYRQQIFDKLFKFFPKLSSCRFASNLVRLVLSVSDEKSTVQALTVFVQLGHVRLVRLAKDEFGIHVMEKLLEQNEVVDVLVLENIEGLREKILQALSGHFELKDLVDGLQELGQ